MAEPGSIPSLPRASANIAKANHEKEQEQERLRAIFAEAVDIPSTFIKHKHTKVIMISWKDPDFRAREMMQEIEDLRTTFRDLFSFDVDDEIILDAKENAALTLIVQLSAWVEKNDRDKTLLIVYYAGHGWSRNKSMADLQLTGSTALDAEQKKHALIAWQGCHDILEMRKRADLLGIFDCCHAGSLNERAPPGFEYLGACQPDRGTAVAGPHSFTRALIWALEDLRETVPWFTAEHLRTHVRKAPNFPPTQYPSWKPCPDRPELIALAPVSQIADVTDENMFEERQIVETVDVRFQFNQTVDDDYLRHVAHALSSIRHQAKVSRISLIEKHGKARTKWTGLMDKLKDMKEKAPWESPVEENASPHVEQMNPKVVVVTTPSAIEVSSIGPKKQDIGVRIQHNWRSAYVCLAIGQHILLVLLTAIAVLLLTNKFRSDTIYLSNDNSWYAVFSLPAHLRLNGTLPSQGRT